ncbi:MAG: glycolate oxidase subunit GlcF [Candidatus Competibacteraceae bacterium]|nr:glycolate oxidase subunit GlcF [Candidatus Competibacteraceae bacterium]
MQTQLADFIKDTPDGQEAESILRACVHCGFCTATCPTYQLLGDELDGPRGRIYLIKQVLEGHAASAKTQLHLDRCLTCRSCETTCPSGVNYHRLADIGRSAVAKQVQRPTRQRLLRWGLRALLPYRNRFTPLLRLGQTVRGILPPTLRSSIPARQQVRAWPVNQHQRRMLLLDGCVQPGLAPNINTATARVLDRLGIQLVSTPQAGCCGAVSYHLDAHQEGLDFMRRNIDAWWPEIEAGAEAIVLTASGCGAMVKEYGHLLRDDPVYADKASRISALSKDIGEILAAEELTTLQVQPGTTLAFHSPCTLQHGQQLNGLVESLLSRLGFQLTSVADPHLCCGSAGTYSILQKTLSRQLRDNKLNALQAGSPEVIATANIGCLTHLQSGTHTPVKHWIEVLDEASG